MKITKYSQCRKLMLLSAVGKVYRVTFQIQTVFLSPCNFRNVHCTLQYSIYLQVLEYFKNQSNFCENPTFKHLKENVDVCTCKDYGYILYSWQTSTELVLSAWFVFPTCYLRSLVGGCILYKEPCMYSILPYFNILIWKNA